eukprot:1084453-Pleurochrysis_carterae.AAC.3
MRNKDFLNYGNTCGFRIVPTYTCIRDAMSACAAPRRHHVGAAGQRGSAGGGSMSGLSRRQARIGSL